MWGFKKKKTAYIIRFKREFEWMSINKQKIYINLHNAQILKKKIILVNKWFKSLEFILILDYSDLIRI